MKHNWKDSTTYGKYSENQKPSAWSLQTDSLRITVMNEHRDYPGRWVMHCFSIGIQNKILDGVEALTLEQAQEMALTLVRSKLQRMIDSLD